MRVAFTGASSTGKTTLALELMKAGAFRNHIDRFIPSAGVDLLRNLGFGGLDGLTQSETSFFELAYFTNKITRELDQDKYIADRSFVDVAAHWLERDTLGASEFMQQFLVEPCQILAGHYDHHFFFPRTSLPFEPDGWRSTDEDFRNRLDRRIKALLEEWSIPFFTVPQGDLDNRARFVLKSLGLTH